MTSPADSLSLILRRLDEIERKLDRMLEELRTPHGHRLFRAPRQSSKEGIRKISPCAGWAGPKKQIFGVVKQVFGRKQSDKDVFGPTSVQSGEGRTDFSLRSANLPRPVNGWGLFNRLELQIDHFVMAITSVGAKVWHTAQVA